ncbi:MAG: ribonuclease III [Amoebophilaceae bacterium]|nr:ribonuclease III [Amoebophilaceae bacterium]
MGRILKLFNYFFTKKDPATRQLICFVKAFSGKSPSNISLYQIALKHSSVEGNSASNERLEFLGDAVLSLVVAEYLFKKYPLKEEGFLSEIRSRLVNREALNNLARKIHVDKMLHYDSHTIRKSGHKFIYGNALEALIGAFYLDHGYGHCRIFIIEQLIHNYISLKTLIENDTNFKSRIIHWGQKHHGQVVFKIIEEKQYEYYKQFTAHVLIDEKVIGVGTGKTKKCAEQAAAEQAILEVETTGL